MNVAAMTAGERRQAERWLEVRAPEAAWRAGTTLVARCERGIAGLARLQEANPGDGYHAEHVRELVLEGDDDALAPLARAAAEAAGAGLRLEARCPAGCAAKAEALLAAGLDLEARLPEAWSEGGVLHDLLCFGRPAASRREPPAETARRAPDGPPAQGLVLRWSDDASIPALRRFLDALVPGRAYPPGTLLSEAERLETQRRGALRAQWLLAFDAAGDVAGGVVPAREPGPARAHVRRVHADVLRAWRGRGVATALFRRAVEDCGRLGIVRLEADPRSGNAGACAALARGGFVRAGTQRGAWRLRLPSRSWDEDVLLMSVRCAGAR